MVILRPPPSAGRARSRRAARGVRRGLPRRAKIRALPGGRSGRRPHRARRVLLRMTCALACVALIPCVRARRDRALLARGACARSEQRCPDFPSCRRLPAPSALPPPPAQARAHSPSHGPSMRPERARGAPRAARRTPKGKKNHPPRRASSCTGGAEARSTHQSHAWRAGGGAGWGAGAAHGGGRGRGGPRSVPRERCFF